MGQDPNKCTGIFEVFLKTEAPFFLLPAWGGCAPKYYCIFGHGAPPLAHQCKKNVGRNISLQFSHAAKLMLFHIFDALIGDLTLLKLIVFCIPLCFVTPLLCLGSFPLLCLGSLPLLKVQGVKLPPTLKWKPFIANYSAIIDGFVIEYDNYFSSLLDKRGW